MPYLPHHEEGPQSPRVRKVVYYIKPEGQSDSSMWFCGLRYSSHGHVFRIVLKRQCYGFDSTDPNISRLLKAQIKKSYPETAFAIQSSLVPS